MEKTTDKVFVEDKPVYIQDLINLIRENASDQVINQFVSESIMDKTIVDKSLNQPDFNQFTKQQFVTEFVIWMIKETNSRTGSEK